MSGMGGLLPTPSGGGNPLALAGNILASLGNPSAANQLASSLLMQGGNQMGFNQGGGSYGGGYGGGQGQMRSYDDRDRVSQTETAPLFFINKFNVVNVVTAFHISSVNFLAKRFLISPAPINTHQILLGSHSSSLEHSSESLNVYYPD